ncbi:MAG: imidazole glycerol phosphate synthase subunit HisH [Candidatus Porifericomitaceae bacterium WSBS_2022_MAG_OTU9]
MFVAIVAHGTGNLHSVERAVQHVGAGKVTTCVSAEPARLLEADRIIFPGQGAIGACRQHLQQTGAMDALLECSRDRPFFGICLGMQLLALHSEEDEGYDGMGIFSTKVKRFGRDMLDESQKRCKVPHMGWNEVRLTQDHPLLAGIEQDSFFYFVHSYYLQCSTPDEVYGETVHGLRFASIMAKGNIFATQFHPEKSQQPGLAMLRNFLHWKA